MPLSEFSIIDNFFSGLDRGKAVSLGVGDDCALLRLGPGEEMAASVDTVVSGVHFPATACAADIGFKAIAAAVSDLAAMGARPLGCTLALTLERAEQAWLRELRRGIAEAVHAFELPLIGGDITRGPLTISVQVMGAVAAGEALLRSGARPGDQVCVSGTLGNAAAALQVLEGTWQPAREHVDCLLRYYYRPVPPLALGRSLCSRATAAIDVSDGFLADAAHIARASGVRIVIESDRMPLSEALCSHPDRAAALQWALSGGDDYELCFCLPPGSALPENCTQVGVVERGEGLSLDGRGLETATGGFHHF